MADFLVFVTVQPSAKPQQMMHRNGKKNAVSRRTTRDFRKKQQNTSRNTSWLNCCGKSNLSGDKSRRKNGRR